MADVMTCSREEHPKGDFERSISRDSGVARAAEKLLFRRVRLRKPEKSFF
jgi:hypothetical protein